VHRLNAARGMPASVSLTPCHDEIEREWPVRSQEQNARSAAILSVLHAHERRGLKALRERLQREPGRARGSNPRGRAGSVEAGLPRWVV